MARTTKKELVQKNNYMIISGVMGKILSSGKSEKCGDWCNVLLDIDDVSSKWHTKMKVAAFGEEAAYIKHIKEGQHVSILCSKLVVTEYNGYHNIETVALVVDDNATVESSLLDMAREKGMLGK